MKFIADSMLGRLARWLRLLGYDTLYYPHIEDNRLLRIAREQNRTLLTRDTRLAKIREMKDFLLLDENDSMQQLKKVVEKFRLAPGRRCAGAEHIGLSGRCSICNGVLIGMRKEDAVTHVPAYVYQSCDHFKKCSGCGKIYWQGTHTKRLRKKLSEILI